MKDIDIKESVSNLITDMTVEGAPLTEIARVVEHSKVVIDAEKHNRNTQEVLQK